MLNSTYLIGNEVYYNLVDPGIIDTEPENVMELVEPEFNEAIEHE
jgi:hypothetical protein